MASGGHAMQFQKKNVEARIERLRNEDMKDICRTFREQVSGNKPELVKRCQRILDDIVRRGDVSAFEQLKKVVGGKELPSLLHNHSNSSNTYSTTIAQAYGMPPRGAGTGAGGYAPQKLPLDGKYFKSSPFYDVLQNLLPLQDLPDAPEMPQNRHTVKATFAVRPDVATQFRGTDGGSLKILLYCGISHSISAYSQTDITFPNQIEIKVNDQDVKHSFKGLKNKPGSTKPADITSFVRKFGGPDNTIQVTYALTNKRFSYAVYLVRSVGVEKLVERIRKGNIIPKEKVLSDMSKANADPDIAATSTRMSLKDPISTVRIALPVRSSHCTHNQCFDGAMYLQLQEQAPQWTCPVCTKSVSFESLCVDKYFEDILNKTSTKIEKVDIEPNGEWRVIRDDDETQANGTSSKARASYDDDFDDLVELDQPVNKTVNGVKGDSYPPTLSPFPGQTYSLHTPPLTSREPSIAQSAASTQRSSNKRPQSAVIDLTLSDEEDDDPPRPAKRQSTIQSQQRSQNAHSNSYNSTNPATESRFQPQSSYAQPNYRYNQSDTYRPTSNHSTNPYTPTSNYHAQSSISPPNPVSPFGQPTNSAQHSLPPIQQPNSMFPPQTSNSPFNPPNFSTRPPSVNSSSGMQGMLRLPPMQTQQSNPLDLNNYRDWWSDHEYGSYSPSPG